MKKTIRLICSAAVIATMLTICAGVSANAISSKNNNGIIRVEGTAPEFAGENVTVMLVKKTIVGDLKASDIAYFGEARIEGEGNFSFKIKCPETGFSIYDYEIKANVGGENVTNTIESAALITELIDVDFKLVDNETYGQFIANVKNLYDNNLTGLNIKAFLTFYTGRTLKGINVINITDTTDVYSKIDIPADADTMKCFLWQDMNPIAKNTVRTIGSSRDISCWGDSLTYGVGGGGSSYPSVLNSLIGGNVSVSNYGVGGENTATITARQGGTPFKLAYPVTIPADTVPVRVVLVEGEPLKQGDGGINPCYIDGIKGTLAVSGGTYTFTRLDAAAAKDVAKGTSIITAASLVDRDDLPVIWTGANDTSKIILDPEGSAQYITEYQRSMINSLNYEDKQYIVIGIADGFINTSNLDAFVQVEDYMQWQYGERFINMRKCLTDEGIYTAAGITLSDSDKTRMENGLIPQAIIYTDGLHFNATGYGLIGKIVFKKLSELGWVVY